MGNCNDRFQDIDKLTVQMSWKMIKADANTFFEHYFNHTDSILIIKLPGSDLTAKIKIMLQTIDMLVAGEQESNIDQETKAILFKKNRTHFESVWSKFLRQQFSFDPLYVHHLALWNAWFSKFR